MDSIRTPIALGLLLLLIGCGLGYNSRICTTRNYAAEILADQPLAYLRLNDTSVTSITDSSGYFNTVTVSGTPTLGASGALSESDNKAMTFNGSQQLQLNLPSLNVASGQRVTMEIWFYWDGSLGLGTIMPFGFSIYDAVIYTVSQGLGFNTSGGEAYGVSATPTLNRWTHLVAEFYGGSEAENKMYLNGVQQTLSSVVGGGPFAGTMANSIAVSGWRVDANNRWVGSLDEFAIYSGTLSADRIRIHYQAGLGTFTRYCQ